MSNLLNIGFRVDAGSTIGTGHLMEIVSLIDSLREQRTFAPLAIINDNAFAQENFTQIGVKQLCMLPDDISEAAESQQIIAFLRDRDCEHLILDVLHRSDEFYRGLSEKLKTTCVILDNNEHRELPASVVVNFSVTQNPEFYRRAGKYRTKYLIGPRYFLWHKTIRTMAKARVREQVRKILVNQGGSDPYGLTWKIVRALAGKDFQPQVHVVLGGLAAESYQNELADLKVQGDFHFYVNLPPVEFYKLMQDSDLAVSAGGNTLYELLFLGVPTLIIGHHELHDRVGRAFAAQEAAINLGIGTRLTEADIAAAVRHLMENYPARLRLQEHATKLLAISPGGTVTDELIELYGQ